MTKITIIQDEKNLLFNRRDIKGFIQAEVIPSKIEFTSLIAKELKVEESFINIIRIKGKFGTQNFEFEVEVYDSAEDLNKLKLKKKEKKKK